MMRTAMTTLTLLTLLTTGCMAAVDGEYGASGEALTGVDACEKEVYYYVVDAENEAEALSACEAVCEGIVCQDWENDAVASIPGNAGDDDTWKCDCTCECDDDRGAGLREAAAQFRDN